MSQVIAVSSWTFNKYLNSGNMDWDGFCAAVRSFGLRHVELNNHFFKSLDDDYIQKLKATLDHYEIEVINIAIDDYAKFPYNSAEDLEFFEKKKAIHIGGALADEDEELRQKGIERTLAWIPVCKALGCKRLRNNTGGAVEGLDETSIKRCADSFRILCDAAAKEDIFITIENHGGISSNIDAMDKLWKQVDRPNLVQALDFGNWPAERRYDSVERSVHRASIIHPKTHDFDEHGEQPEWDTYRMAKVVMRSGFSGPWVIEFEGKTQDTFEGLGKSIAMIKRCFAA